MQYDIHRLPGDVLVVDLQTDLINIGTRVVAPLVPQGARAIPLPALEPVVRMDGVAYLLLVSEMSALPARLLGPAVGDLRHEEYVIRRAVDMVFTGI